MMSTAMDKQTMIDTLTLAGWTLLSVTPPELNKRTLVGTPYWIEWDTPNSHRLVIIVRSGRGIVEVEPFDSYQEAVDRCAEIADEY